MVTATALVGPTGPEAIEAAAQVAEVVALGASVLDLDPRAQEGITFLWDRIHQQFLAPALATDSSEVFHELWQAVDGPVLRDMHALTVLLYEGARGSQSEVMNRRLAHGDTTAIAQLAQKLTTESSTSERLRRTSVLISDARTRLKDVLASTEDVNITHIKGFHTGVLLWGLGVGLCAEIAKHVAKPAAQPLRSSLITDAVEFAASGARLAGVSAALSGGLQLAAATPDLKPLLSNDDGIAFLVRATQEIPRAFGPKAAFRLEHFRYPDAPNEYQYHVVIDSPAPPAEASERLDALCDSWWDEAAASLGIDLYPVVGHDAEQALTLLRELLA